MPQNSFAAKGAEPTLRSGLYVVRSFVSTAEEQAYVLYWPEDTTWNDQAASTVKRNRETFMRYDFLYHSLFPQIESALVGISRNYAIRLSVYCRQSIHKQLCGVMTMVTMYRLIRTMTTRAGSMTLLLREQTIKKRILLPDQDSRYFFGRAFFLVIDLSSFLLGRWTRHFFFINNLRPASMSITSTYFQGYYMAKLFKVS